MWEPAKEKTRVPKAQKEQRARERGISLLKSYKKVREQRKRKEGSPVGIRESRKQDQDNREGGANVATGFQSGSTF